MRKFLLSGILAAALAACDESSVTPPDAGTLSRADAELLAQEFDALVGSVLGGGLGPHFSVAGSARASAAPVPVNVTFSRTHACPKGGSVTVAGTTTGEGDRATRTLTTETNATKTQAACAFQARNGTVITTTGNPNLAIKDSRKIVNGQPSGPQTTTQKGAFNWSTSTGKSGSCTVDITSTLDPAAKTRTVKGTMCGRTVDVTKPVRG